MAKINNYIIVDDNHYLTTELIGSTILGELIGDDIDQDKKRIQRKIVGMKKDTEVSETIICFENGEEFELALPHVDYNNYINAIEEGYPVIRDWNLFGSKNIGYRILGKVEGRIIIDDIIFQDGNFIFNREGRGFFVDWLSYSDIYFEKIVKTKKLLDIDYLTEFDYFCGQKCRPKQTR